MKKSICESSLILAIYILGFSLMRMAADYGQDLKDPYSKNEEESPDYLQVKNL